jgi:carbon-monoxide dehydrogenase medium subunit
MDIDHGRLAPRKVLSLRLLPWKSLDWSGTGLTIGSTLPLRDLESDPMLRERIPGLWQAVRAVGGVALRHRATLGGNVVRSAPASDLLPILLALDAEVEIVGPKGSRRVELDRFLDASRRPKLESAELLCSVHIPESRPSIYLWQRVRPVNDISQVGVAVARSPSTARWQIAVGDVVPRPVRIREAEAALGQGDPATEAVRKAVELVSSQSPFATDRRGTELYRRRVVGALVERSVQALIGRAPARRSP